MSLAEHSTKALVDELLRRGQEGLFTEPNETVSLVVKEEGTENVLRDRTWDGPILFLAVID